MVSQVIEDIAAARQSAIDAVVNAKDKFEESEQKFLEYKLDYYTSLVEILDSGLISRDLLADALGTRYHNIRELYRVEKCKRGECISKSTTTCKIAGHLKNNWKNYKNKEA